MRQTMVRSDAFMDLLAIAHERSLAPDYGIELDGMLRLDLLASRRGAADNKPTPPKQ
ncbi:hypothetical protein [Achromobacter kerstersii]|jgi:hypothetical protein